MTIPRNLSFLAEGASSAGVLGVANGGSAATTLTGYLIGNGTSAFTASSTIPTTALSGTVTNAQLTNSAITINGTSTSLGGSISVGTVTSVAATVPAFLTITGSPITSSGTLAITLSGTALPVVNGGTGVTSSTGTSKTVLSSLPAFDTTIGVGAATASASGAGITFPATQSASTNVNTLDDYEEGTWTPTQGAGLTVVGGFTSSGTYTKVGNLVYVSGIVQGGTSVTYAGGTSILTAGLPFTINSGYGGGGGNAINSALAAGCGLVGNRGTDSIYGDTAIASTLRIFFSLTYVV